jgi:broad specificity phosphatase PhoE
MIARTFHRHLGSCIAAVRVQPGTDNVLVVSHGLGAGEDSFIVFQFNAAEQSLPPCHLSL